MTELIKRDAVKILLKGIAVTISGPFKETREVLYEQDLTFDVPENGFTKENNPLSCLFDHDFLMENIKDQDWKPVGNIKSLNGDEFSEITNGFKIISIQILTNEKSKIPFLIEKDFGNISSKKDEIKESEANDEMEQKMADEVLTDDNFEPIN